MTKVDLVVVLVLPLAAKARTFFGSIVHATDPEIVLYFDE